MRGFNAPIGSWKTTPIFLRNFLNSSLESSSSLLLEPCSPTISSDKTTEPDVGSTSLSKVRISVVFPQPLSPTIPNVLPDSISKSTPSKAFTNATSFPQEFLTEKYFFKFLTLRIVFIEHQLHSS